MASEGILHSDRQKAACRGTRPYMYDFRKEACRAVVHTIGTFQALREGFLKTVPEAAWGTVFEERVIQRVKTHF